MISWGPILEEDEWTLATWHCYYGAQLLFLTSVDGVPRLDYHPSSELYKAYRWNSYHAARKFQRSHAALTGYIVCNLSAIKRQCEAERERERST